MRHGASRKAPSFVLREPPWFSVFFVVKTCLFADERTPRSPKHWSNGPKMCDPGMNPPAPNNGARA